MGGKLLGVVTTRDWDFITDLHTPLSEVMTADVETAQYGERLRAGRWHTGCSLGFAWLARCLPESSGARVRWPVAAAAAPAHAPRWLVPSAPECACTCTCTHSLHCADTITAEKAMALLKASKRGKLPIVNGNGELLALATRALFREDARMPLGGETRLAIGGLGRARCFAWWG